MGVALFDDASFPGWVYRQQFLDTAHEHRVFIIVLTLYFPMSISLCSWSFTLQSRAGVVYAEQVLPMKMYCGLDNTVSLN